MSRRSETVLWLNGGLHAVPAEDAMRPLSSWLREVKHLPGTKLACAAGECGACTVLAASAESPLHWSPINSCLVMPAQLHGWHVRTVEGLSTQKELSPVQAAMISEHGLQCGYCTPGFVATMTGALHHAMDVPTETIDRAWWREALAGNLCRCTGYDSILAAAACATRACEEQRNAGHRPFAMLCDRTWADVREPLREPPVVSDSVHDSDVMWRPATLAEALVLRERAPQRVVVAGGTDLMPAQADHAHASAPMLLIGHLAELHGCHVEDAPASGVPRLRIGAACSWATLQRTLEPVQPMVARLIDRCANPQIRQLATVGGQIATASSIGDLLPWLLVHEAEVKLASPSRTYMLTLGAFLRDPTTALHGMLLTEVVVPLPAAAEHVVVEKASRRRDADVATVAVAARIASLGHRVEHVALAVGGMGPRACRLPAAEAVLRGATINNDVVESAVRAADAEVHPWSDVRGSAGHRRMLLAELLGGLLRDVFQTEAAAGS